MHLAVQASNMTGSGPSEELQETEAELLGTAAGAWYGLHAMRFRILFFWSYMIPTTPRRAVLNAGSSEGTGAGAGSDALRASPGPSSASVSGVPLRHKGKAL